MKNRSNQLISDVHHVVQWVEVHSEEEDLQLQKLFAFLDYSIVSIPIALYSVTNIIMLQIECSAWVNMLVLLLAYMTMLILVSFLVLIQKQKNKGKNEFVYSSEDLVSCFNYILLLITIFCFTLGFYEGRENAKIIGVVNLVLFAGFAFSLKDFLIYVSIVRYIGHCSAKLKL